MAKLIITEKQYNKILVNEAISRTLLSENNKEVVLGVALLLGMNLSGLNKELAHKYIKNDKVVNNIKTILNNEYKTDELIKNMEEKGMGDVKSLLKSKSRDIVKNFDKFCGPEKHDADMNVKIINNLDKI